MFLAHLSANLPWCNFRYLPRPIFSRLHQSYGIDRAPSSAYLGLHEFKQEKNKSDISPGGYTLRRLGPPGEHDVLKTDLHKNDVPKNEKKIPTDHNEQSEWQTYRTRFTIRARMLSAPLSFVDALGREQNGKRGDYLVESNGMITITPRHIFEDVYVAMEDNMESNREANANSGVSFSAQPPRKSPISTTKRSFLPASRRRSG